MKGFLSRIKGKMSQEFGGRYLGEVLAEVFREEPSMTAILWRKSLKDFSVVTDSDYLDSRERLADLALIGRNSGETMALAEIKYDDEKGSENQLERYLDFAKQKKVAFIYLTKNFLPKKQRELITAKGFKCHMLYSELGENLEKWIQKNPASCYGRLLADFLRDEGVMWNKSFSEKAIKTLIIKAGRFPHRHGFGKLVAESRMTEDIPAVFAGLMNNIAILGRVIHNEFDPNGELVKTSPSIDFSFDPYYSKKALLKLLAATDASDDGFAVDRWGNAVIGGAFLVKAQFTVQSDPDPYLLFSVYICFSLNKGNKELMAEVGSSVYGSKLSDRSSCEILELDVDKNGNINLDENDMRKFALEHIASAINSCVKDEKQLGKAACIRLKKISAGCANKT